MFHRIKSRRIPIDEGDLHKRNRNKVRLNKEVEEEPFMKKENPSY